ncbi:MAG: hypothetical protein EXS63_05410 [Candidatus Omnitrophica bacterium]|nr:hypothetical protein [Candidatus Omnitrophota bacterium]
MVFFQKSRRSFARLLLVLILPSLLTGCAFHPPYTGVNPQNPQFERGISCPPLDFFGDLISKIYQLLFWTSKYGNHRISPETEKAMAEFMEKHHLTDVKVRLNQWAPHKEMGRLFTNKNVAWPYKIFLFPSTLIASLLGRPFSGLLISDYYDPGSNTINIFSDSVPIALHEAGHANDFATQELKGTYSLARILPGINLVQEALATDEALQYLEEQGKYQELLQAYKILFPAYTTYILSYIPLSPPALVGGIFIGHIVGRMKASDKEWQLRTEGKYPATQVVPPVTKI